MFSLKYSGGHRERCFCETDIKGANLVMNLPVKKRFCLENLSLCLKTDLFFITNMLLQSKSNLNRKIR